MAPNPKLHKMLIVRQSSDELKRKADKAKSKSVWTQEDDDWVQRRMIDHMRHSRQSAIEQGTPNVNGQ